MTTRPQPVRARAEVRLVQMRHHTGLDDRILRRRAEKGEFIRLRNGAFVPAAVWRTLSADDRERLTIAAAHDLRNLAFVATHRSAAQLWGMPVLGRWNGLIDVRTTLAAGTRVENGYRKHAVAHPEQHVTAVDGIPVTTVARTVVDLAMQPSFGDGVVAADWALAHGVTADDLLQTLDEVAPYRGRARAEAVIGFADGRSGSPGESVSRVQIAQAGLPAPELQVEFRDRAGLIGFVDFYWPEFRLVGEFDGLVKYRKPELLAGREPEEVVVEEKVREDRLRALGPGIRRWVWKVLDVRGELPALLRAAGLPQERGR